MKILREIATGVIFAILSVLVIASAFSLSFAESNPIAFVQGGEELLLISTENATQGFSPSSSPTLVIHQPTRTPTVSPTSLPSPTICPPPKDWQAYTVQSGDTVETLALAYSISNEELKQANCLISDSLISGTILFVPPVTQASAAPELPPTPIPCGPPTGWIPYIVEPTDTLSLVAIRFSVSQRELRYANCLDNSAQIHTGDTLYVPSEPILPNHITPSLTPTIPENTATPVPSETPTLSPTNLNTLAATNNVKP